MILQSDNTTVVFDDFDLMLLNHESFQLGYTIGYMNSEPYYCAKIGHIKYKPAYIRIDKSNASVFIYDNFTQLKDIFSQLSKDKCIDSSFKVKEISDTQKQYDNISISDFKKQFPDVYKVHQAKIVDFEDRLKHENEETTNRYNSEEYADIEVYHSYESDLELDKGDKIFLYIGYALGIAAILYVWWMC